MKLFVYSGIELTFGHLVITITAPNADRALELLKEQIRREPSTPEYYLNKLTANQLLEIDITKEDAKIIFTED